jgi:pyruvate-ferredoxin/flavodoxin oxidoreductase
VAAGYWPLYRFTPADANPFKLDSKKPTVTFDQFARGENRYAQLLRKDPAQAEALFKLAQADMDARWRYYEQLAGVGRTAPADGRSATLNVLRTGGHEAEE